MPVDIAQYPNDLGEIAVKAQCRAVNPRRNDMTIYLKSLKWHKYNPTGFEREEFIDYQQEGKTRQEIVEEAMLKFLARRYVFDSHEVTFRFLYETNKEGEYPGYGDFYLAKFILRLSSEYEAAYGGSK